VLRGVAAFKETPQEAYRIGLWRGGGGSYATGACKVGNWLANLNYCGCEGLRQTQLLHVLRGGVCVAEMLIELRKLVAVFHGALLTDHRRRGA